MPTQIYKKIGGGAGDKFPGANRYDAVAIMDHNTLQNSLPLLWATLWAVTLYRIP